MSPTTYLHASRATFDQQGFSPALVCGEEDCGICLMPLAQALPSGTTAKLSDEEKAFLESGESNIQAFMDHLFLESGSSDILAFKARYTASGNPLDTGHPGLQIKACGHVFGAACIQKWLLGRNSCPMCRTKLFPPTEVCEGRAEADPRSHWNFTPGDGTTEDSWWF